MPSSGGVCFCGIARIHLSGDSNTIPLFNGHQIQRLMLSFSNLVHGTARRVAIIYGQVLSVEEISLNDNFFDLGGDSLLAAQVLVCLHRTVPETKTMTLRAVFDQPTARRLADWLKGKVSENDAKPI